MEDNEKVGENVTTAVCLIRCVDAKQQIAGNNTEH